MASGNAAGANSTNNAHMSAARAFVERAVSRLEEDISSIYVFGSTARGEAEGLSSDVDVLGVLPADAERAQVEAGLHEIAHDVMLEFGPVVELNVLTVIEFERARERKDPFVRNALTSSRP